MSTSKTALKSGVVYAIATMINAGLTFLTTPFFTRVMTQENYGQYNNFLSWYNILMIVSLNLSSTLISARQDYKKEIDSYILSMSALNGILVSFFGVVVFIFNNFFNRYIGLSRIYIFMMFMYIAFNQIFTLYQVTDRFSFRYKTSAIFIIICAITSAILPMGLVMIMKNQLLGRVIGLVIPTVIMGSVCEILFIKKGKRIRWQHWKYAVPICLPYIPHLLSLTILNALDKTMINSMVGSVETAIYSVAYTCGSALSLVVSMLNNAYVPWLAEKISEGDEKSVRKFSKYYIGIFQAVLITILLFAPEMVEILGGKQYSDAVTITPAIMVGCGMQLIYTMYVNVEQFYKNTKWMAVVSVVAAVSNGILNYIFIPLVGYKIAAVTTVASYLVLAIGHIIVVEKMRCAKYYSAKFSVIILITDIIAIPAFKYLYNYTTVRFFVIVVYFMFFLTLMYIKRDALRKVIENIRK